MSEIIIHEDMPLPEIARAAAASRFFQLDPAQAIIKVLMGRELGVAPIASLTDIHIIQGKPVVGSGMIAARIKASGKYNYKVKTSDDTRCDLEFFEEGESQGIHSYTMERAKRAGNAGKDNYRKHAEDMLFARAISSGYKKYCPDVFQAKVYTPGEIEEEPTEAPHRQAERPPVAVSSVSAPKILDIRQEPVVIASQEILDVEAAPAATYPRPGRETMGDTLEKAVAAREHPQPAPRRRRKRAI